MKEKDEFERARPSEKENSRDPQLPNDESATPPSQTISSSDSYAANEQLTEVAKNSFREDEGEDPRADRRFDQAGDESDLGSHAEDAP